MYKSLTCRSFEGALLLNVLSVIIKTNLNLGYVNKTINECSENSSIPTERAKYLSWLPLRNVEDPIDGFRQSSSICYKENINNTM